MDLVAPTLRTMPKRSCDLGRGGSVIRPVDVDRTSRDQFRIAVISPGSWTAVSKRFWENPEPHKIGGSTVSKVCLKTKTLSKLLESPNPVAPSRESGACNAVPPDLMNVFN